MAATSSSLRVLKDIRTILRIKKEFPSFCLPTLSSAKTPQLSSSEDVSIPNLNPVIEDSAKRNAKNLRHELISVIRMHSESEKSEEELKTLRSALSSYAELLISLKQSKYLRALDSGERLDPRDKISRTAARVGFSVPKYSDDENALNQPLGKLPSS